MRNSQSPECEERKVQREKLLEQRLRLRQRLGKTGEEQIATVQLELAMITNRRRTARTIAKAREERLI